MASINTRATHKRGFEAGAAYAQKVGALCAQAGKPERTDFFIARRASLDDVRVALGLGTKDDADGWDKAIAALATNEPNDAGAASWGKAIAALGPARRRR